MLEWLECLLMMQEDLGSVPSLSEFFFSIHAKGGRENTESLRNCLLSSRSVRNNE